MSSIALSAAEARRHLYPAGVEIFKAIKKSQVDGILVGGAAAVLSGANRFTRDLDINVTDFPDTSNYPKLYQRPGTRETMRKITYNIPGEGKFERGVFCDISTNKLRFMGIYMKYSKELPQYPGINIASLPLLLADKIATCAKRQKGSDVQDIVWCVEQIFAYEDKDDGKYIPEDIKSLYSNKDWEIALEKVKRELGSGDYDYFVQVSQAIGVRHPEKPDEN